MAKPAGIGVTDSWWANYTADMRGLARRAQEVADDLDTAEIGRLVLRATHGDELAEVIELAARPLGTGIRRRRAYDVHVEEAMAELAAEDRELRATPPKEPLRPRRLIEFTSSRRWKGWRVVDEQVLQERERADAERRGRVKSTQRPVAAPYRGGRGRFVVRPQTQ